MDSSLSQFDEKRKNQIEEALVKVIINAYQKKDLSYFDMKKSASYILSHIDKITNSSELFYFLENLSFYWPIFKSVFVMEKQGENKMKEQEIISKLSGYIKNLPAN